MNGPTTQIALRLDAETIERVDAFAKRLGLRSRSEAMRVLIKRGTEVFEARQRDEQQRNKSP